MLTDTAIRSAKPGPKARQLFDGKGLYLEIQPASSGGAKLWRVAFRYRGKKRRLAVGSYPATTLAQARAKLAKIKAQLEAGEDPSELRRIEKMQVGRTFREVAVELVAKLEKEGKAAATLKKKRYLFKLADRHLGDKPVGAIKPTQILAVLRVIEGKEKFETARALRANIGMVMRYAVATGRAERDPTADLRGALVTPPPGHYAAITKASEIAPLLRAIDGYEGKIVRLALQLIALTFVRPGELRKAEWKEISGSTWTIPAERMKAKREHRVPLSKQGLAVLAELRPLTGGGKFLFPSVRTTSRPMSDGTLNAALRRLAFTKDEMVAHGFRHLASVQLNEMGFQPDVIEKQLAHEIAGKVRRAYLHPAEWWPQRVEMMQTWADYLDGLRDHGSASKSPADVIVTDSGATALN